MRVSRSFSADFDDPDLVSTAGLVPVMGLAASAGLHQLVAERLTVAGAAGVNAAVKVPALVAGMIAGADSIAEMGLLRHGGMGPGLHGWPGPGRWPTSMSTTPSGPPTATPSRPPATATPG